MSGIMRKTFDVFLIDTMALCCIYNLRLFMVLIRYEQLVHEPQKVLRPIIEAESSTAALGLKWDQRVLQFHKSNRTVNTHSMSRKYGLSLPVYPY